MKSHEFKLFYSPFCNVCPEAKKIVRNISHEKKIPLKEINIFSPDGQKTAEIFNVVTVPCLIIDNINRIDGIPVKEQIEIYLE